MSEEKKVLWDVLQHTELACQGLENLHWFDALVEQMQDAHKHWSGLSLDWFDWCAYVVACLQRSASPDQMEEWLARSHMQDLYLAFGCVWGSDEALQTVQVESDALLKQIVRRFAKPPLMPEELQQELWISIFVSTDKRPCKLESYAGQGPLQAWLRVTAVRKCIDYTRMHPHLQKEQVTEKEQLLEMPEQTFDVELEFLKQEYRGHFREAFAKGVARLSSRDRLLLRYHVIEGLSIDQIGALFQQHRSTAARQLNQARQHLLTATEQELMDMLHISQTEFKSVMRLIQSQWEVSVQRLLEQQRLSSLAHEQYSS